MRFDVITYKSCLRRPENWKTRFEKFEKERKKFLTNGFGCVKIEELSNKRRPQRKLKIKKL